MRPRISHPRVVNTTQKDVANTFYLLPPPLEMFRPPLSNDMEKPPPSFVSTPTTQHTQTFWLYVFVREDPPYPPQNFSSKYDFPPQKALWFFARVKTPRKFPALLKKKFLYPNQPRVF